MKPWYQRDPDLVDEIRGDLRTRHPDLHLFIQHDGKAFVRGTFPVLLREGQVVDRYRIEIEIPRDYPRSLPVVREVGGRIPWKPDFHVNQDGTACVFIPDDRQRCFPEGAPFIQFLDGPVQSFFLGQTIVARGGDWPFGEWSHGEKGVREYYRALVGTENDDEILRFLEVLSKKEIKGHLPCPCGSGLRIRHCCKERLIDLRSKTQPQVARKALETLFPNRRGPRYRSV